MTDQEPSGQSEAVKSAAQAQLPAVAQLAGTDSGVPQSVPQSAEPTAQSIEPGKFPHEWWQTRFDHLISERDAYARVCAAYVLATNWELAVTAAIEVHHFKQELEKHLQLFTDYQAQKDAD